MKKLTVLVLAICFCFLMVGCHKNTSENVPAETTTEETTEATKATEETVPMQRDVYLPSIADVVGCYSYLHKEQRDNSFVLSKGGEDVIIITLEEYGGENGVSPHDVVRHLPGMNTMSDSEIDTWLSDNSEEQSDGTIRYGDDTNSIIDKEGTIVTISLLNHDYSDSYKQLCENLSIHDVY